MSSITSPSLFSGQLYQMPGQSATSTASTTSDQSGGTSADTQAGIAQSLLAALNPSSDSGSLLGNTQDESSLLDSAYSLDLSPQAQSLMSSLGLNTSGSSADSSGSSLTNGNGFLLTPQQQQTISNIIAKYADAPFTQATFSQIQSDLQAAGLSPDQLSLQDDMRSFNTTSIMLNALNGQQTQIANPLSNGTEQSNANAYMQQIYNQWQSVSTTASAATDSSGSTST